MDNKSRRSLASTGARSRRSKSATPGPRSRKSGGTKSRKSFGSKKSGGKYSKLKDADEIEMADLGKIGGDLDMINMGPVAVPMGNNA